MQAAELGATDHHVRFVVPHGLNSEMGAIKEGGGSGSCTSNDIDQLGENKRLLLYLCSGVIQTLYRSIDFVFASALPHH